MKSLQNYVSISKICIKIQFKECTHKSGHTLDLVLTRSADSIIENVIVTDPLISDHSAVHFNLSCSKPCLSKKVISYRQLKSVNIESFKADIVSSNLSSFTSHSPSILVQRYNTVLHDLVEKHAPLKVKEVTIRPSARWYSSEIDVEKRKLRKLEKKYRKTKSPEDYSLCENQGHVLKISC